LLHHANKIKFISHGDYCPSLVSVYDQAHCQHSVPAAAVIAAVALVLVAADYHAAVYPDTRGDLAAMRAGQISAYWCLYSVGAACASHLADLYLGSHLVYRALMCPALHAAQSQVAHAFDPDLPGVIAARNLVMTVEHLYHASAAPQNVAMHRNRDQVLLNVDFLGSYCLAHRVHAAVLAGTISSVRLVLYSAASLQDRAVRNDSCSDEDHAAAQFSEDSGHRNISFGKSAVVQAEAPNGDPTYPSHFCADSSHDPNAHPSVAPNHNANLQNKQVDGGNSALEHAK
jgi:hypothetical protein